MNRISVIRLDALGDTLLSTPALRSLKLAFPECQLTIYASPAGSRVLQGLGQIRTVRPGEGPRAIGREIRQSRADCVLVFTEKRAGYLGAYLSRAPRRAGFDPGLSQPVKALWLRLALTDRLVYPNDPHRDSGLHEVERYYRLVERVGVPPAEPGPLHLPLSEELETRGAAWLAARNLERPVALQLTPRWGLPASFLHRLLAALPQPRVAFHGPAEREWAEKLLRGIEVAACCLPDPLEYAAVLKGCRLLVTPDTGAAHVAAAAGVPVVDVFATRNHEHCVRRWKPWGVPHRVVLKPACDAQAEQPLLERVLAAVSEL